MRIYTNSTEFQRKIENSVNQICDYVLATYGPFGKNILISENGKTFLTKDGVTVAKSIYSSDSTENAILTILKEAADKTVKDAGDGTTTSILFIKEFMRILKETVTAFSHIPSTTIYNCYNEQLKLICRKLEEDAVEVSDKKMLRDIAFMASNGDSIISELVSELIDNVGVAGSISIQPSKSEKTYIKIMEGLKFNSSVASNLLLDDLSEKIKLNDCVIVVSNTKIAYSDDLLRLLADTVENKKSLLFVCPDMDEKAVLTIVTNVQRKAVQACIISPAVLGNEKLEILEDVALICGTTVNPTQHLNRSKISEWGFAKSVEITKTNCTIIDGKAAGVLVDSAVEALRAKLRDEDHEPAARRIEARIARLTSTLGVLFVGGATDAEAVEKRHRVEDALESCHSAMRKGVLPGGGAALYHLADLNLYIDNHDMASTKYLINDFINRKLCELLKKPSQTLYEKKDFILQNSKLEIDKVLDLRSNLYVNPIEEGLIESVWTIQAALINAFSAAWVLTNCFGSIIQGEENVARS